MATVEDERECGTRWWRVVAADLEALGETWEQFKRRSGIKRTSKIKNRIHRQCRAKLERKVQRRAQQADTTPRSAQSASGEGTPRSQTESDDEAISEIGSYGGTDDTVTTPSSSTTSRENDEEDGM